MNFLEALETIGVPRSQQKCKVGAWIDTLEENDKPAVENHITDLRMGTSTVTANWLFRVCKLMGLDTSLQPFYFHIQGECKCPK